MEKEKSRLWARRDDLPGGKYITLRRDGTIFPEPNFVLGPRDPATAAALRAYADEAERLGWHAPFIQDIRELADFSEKLVAGGDVGDPDRGPHRKDCSAIIAMMVRSPGPGGEIKAFADVVDRLQTIKANLEGGRADLADAMVDSLLTDLR